MNTDDLGLVLEAEDPGDGDSEPRSKRLLRHRSPIEAVVDISSLMHLV